MVFFFFQIFPRKDTLVTRTGVNLNEGHSRRWEGKNVAFVSDWGRDGVSVDGTCTSAEARVQHLV